MTISNNQVIEKINSNFSSQIVNTEDSFGTLVCELHKEHAHDIIKFLKNDSALQINFLTLIGGVHYPNDKNREFAVVYHLHSLINNYRIRLKVFLPSSSPNIKSITDIYDSANWQERETFDFYGIIFDGHPNLTRILNEDSMDYHPMRKEYHLEDATREDKDDRFFGR